MQLILLGDDDEGLLLTDEPGDLIGDLSLTGPICFALSCFSDINLCVAL
jgi:hypothetical protein